MLLSLMHKHINPEQVKIAWFIMVVIVPVGLTGFLFENFIATNLLSILAIAVTTTGFGLLCRYSNQKNVGNFATSRK